MTTIHAILLLMLGAEAPAAKITLPETDWIR